MIQDYINAFRAHVRRFQETEYVFFIFDHYIDVSTKEVIRFARDKGATKVFKMKFTSKLIAEKLIFSVATNKTELIDYIIANLIAHNDD